jgi:hypothetical protein
MKTLATLLLSLSLPGLHVSPPPRSPADHKVVQQARKGRWYFAENGHAVYCYGPVMIVPQANGSLQRVATFCQDDKTMVPLRD